MNATDHICEVNDENFDQLVVAESHRVPVMVDFWAEWCAPCRALAPLLAKLAAEYEGRFILAKCNTEQAQRLARDHGIRSIPTVKIFKDGVVVDECLGLLPESSLRTLLDRHVPRISDAQREQAEALLEGGDTPAATALLRETLRGDPDNPRVRFDLAQALLDNGESGAAEEVLTDCTAEQRDSVVYKRLVARIGFARAVENAADAIDLEQRLQTEPGDCTARYQLGAGCVLNGNFERAAEEFLEIMRRDRRYRDDAGRTALLAMFDLIDSDDPRLPKYRARMAAVLH